ncbi:hypothetical protein [Halovivax sp.]|uniref:hypothetical protein n=1 Tax=Halovivax sp. TaxID=1935978 RepID=UPI0025BF2B3F|nr:hypothetical protein [Halovivax sp.]
MKTPTPCPLCQDEFDGETDLRVHLEVEHRKSELAAFVADRADGETDPTVERDARAPTI